MAEKARENAAARLALPYKKRMGQVLDARRWEDTINEVLDQVGGPTERGKKLYDDTPTNMQKLRDDAAMGRNYLADEKAQRVPPNILLEHYLGGQDPRSPMYDPRSFTQRSEEDI